MTGFPGTAGPRRPRGAVRPLRRPDGRARSVPPTGFSTGSTATSSGASSPTS
ncbi:MAG: hypothetical protein M0C28_38815 [Candidatus Moduliflexus flocculans]|nr:hypothetical protein [Candidatus Moduliflexus flocculans]